ncbi:MAG TPA: GatB/YqeY domain-containing protein [Anaerolineae bacterium]|nr:GatB/YqeY domain-containing protein [Anaerolineae bacterium]
MESKEQLSADLKEAMRQQDEVRKRTIRSVIAAIKQAETELDSQGERVKLDEPGVLAIIARQAKQRQESIVEYQKGGRQDLVADEQAELAILEQYLPTQLSRQEIEEEVRRTIQEVGATGPHDIGKVMRPLMNRLRGRADGQLINTVVREMLAGTTP